MGGRYGESGDEQPVLVVAVAQRAVEGAATAAVLSAVAKAFGVRPRDVRLVTGERSRTKVLDIDPAPADAVARLVDLLDGAGPEPDGRPNDGGAAPHRGTRHR